MASFSSNFSVASSASIASELLCGRSNRPHYVCYPSVSLFVCLYEPRKSDIKRRRYLKKIVNVSQAEKT